MTDSWVYHALMSDGLPPHEGFGEIPFLNELMKMIQGQSTGRDDTARHLAHSIANDGVDEPNIDPIDRLAVEELWRVAELNVAATTDLPVARHGALRVEVSNRSQWADHTITHYRPLFEELSNSMTAAMGAPPELPRDDPMAALLAGLSQVLGPMMLGMTTGSLVGHLAQRTFGGYDLPVPRPASAPLLILLRNVDDFGDEWSLDPADLRLWVCLHEVTTQTVLGVSHVRERLTALLHRHAGAFETNPDLLGDRLGGFDLSAGPEAFAQLQAAFGDPEVLLGAVRSREQEILQPEITALVAAITGYVDSIMDSIGSKLIGSYPRITEALRRRRVENDASDRFVERVLGLELDAAQYDRGARFTAGILERAGSEGLSRLFVKPDHLPTPAEVDAPGLWLARIDLPS